MAANVVNFPRAVSGILEQAAGRSSAATNGTEAKGAGFAEQLGKLLTETNDAQLEAARMQDAFMSGEPVELHQVMIKAEEAGLTMDLLLEIRNKLVSAVNDLTKMPL